MAIRNVLSGLFTGFGEYARGMAVKQAEEKAKLEREQEILDDRLYREGLQAREGIAQGILREAPEFESPAIRNIRNIKESALGGASGTPNIFTGGVGMQRGAAGPAGIGMQPQPTAAQVLPEIFRGQALGVAAGPAKPTVAAGIKMPEPLPQRPPDIMLGGKGYYITSPQERAAEGFEAATGMTRPEYEEVLARARAGDKAAQSILASLEKDWLTPSERESAREASQAERDVARLEAEARMQAARDAAELERIRLQNQFKTGLPAAMGDMQEQINDYVENYSMTPRPNDIIDMAKQVAIKYGVDSRIIERAFMPTLPPSGQGGR